MRGFVTIKNAAGLIVGAAVLSLPAVLLAQGLGISRVTASRLSSSSATIAWSTAIRSDSQVVYGSSEYGRSSPRDTAMVEFHSQILTGLEPGTLYHFRVQSVAEDGTTSVSGDFVFQTLPGPATQDASPTPVAQPAALPVAVRAQPARDDRPVETAAAVAPTKAAPPNEQNRKGSCDLPDPYSALGGVGLCVEGRWIELWKASPIPTVRMRKRGGKTEVPEDWR